MEAAVISQGRVQGGGAPLGIAHAGMEAHGSERAPVGRLCPPSSRPRSLPGSLPPCPPPPPPCMSICIFISVPAVSPYGLSVCACKLQVICWLQVGFSSPLLQGTL